MTKGEKLHRLGKKALGEILEWLFLCGRSPDDYSSWIIDERIEYLEKKLTSKQVDVLANTASHKGPPFFSDVELSRIVGMLPKYVMLDVNREALENAMKRLAKEGRCRLNPKAMSKEEMQDYLFHKCKQQELALLLGFIEPERYRQAIEDETQTYSKSQESGLDRTSNAGNKDSAVSVGTNGPDPKSLISPFQTSAVDTISSWYREKGKAGILSLPTGAGKTKVAAWFLMKNVIDRGRKVLWIAGRDELIDQAAEVFVDHAPLASKRSEISVSRYQAGKKKNLDGDVVVASVQSLHGKSAWKKLRPAVLVVDECHHSPAKTYSNIIRHFAGHGTCILGLTATPTRTRKGERPILKRLFPDWIIFRERYLPLVKIGVLAEPKHVVVKIGKQGAIQKLTRKEIAHIEKFREVSDELLGKLASDMKRNNEIVNHFVKHRREYGQTLVFACNKMHAQKLDEMFNKQGIESRCIVSGKNLAGISTSKGERAHIVNDFRTKIFQVLCNIEILSEGADLPLVNTVLMARPTMSETLYSQMIGRGSRGPRVGGKDSFFVVDFVDNFERFKNALAANYVFETEFPEQSRVGCPAKHREQEANHPIPVEALSQIEDMLLEEGISSEQIVDFVKENIAGWYEVQDASGLVRSLVVYQEDEEDIELAWDSLESAIEDRNVKERYKHADRSYRKFLDSSVIDFDSWEKIVELAIESGTHPRLHRLLDEDLTTPDLESVVDELTNQDEFLKLIRLDEIYDLHYRETYPRKQEFLQKLSEINIERKG